MSKSPLSGAFAGSSEPAKKNKKNGALLLISGIALATSIGGVLAAGTITINGTDDIEFGQGIEATSVCNAAADVTVNQEFDTTAEDFHVTTVVVTFGDATACNGLTTAVGLVLDDSGDISYEDATGVVSGDAVTVDFTADDLLASQVTDVTVTTAD